MNTRPPGRQSKQNRLCRLDNPRGRGRDQKNIQAMTEVMTKVEDIFEKRGHTIGREGSILYVEAESEVTIIQEDNYRE